MDPQTTTFPPAPSLPLATGDRVQIPGIATYGTVLAGLPWVEVRWDDGTEGLLYWDLKMVPSAYRLVRRELP